MGLIARNARGLKILGGHASYNWKQHLRSTQEREDLADWMSYHQNETDEWLRYGAAIYLRDCDGFEVKGVTVHGGQNGLMITGCDQGLIWNNDFSFNSSLGLGMYRSSDNRIMHNKMDWNLRGFSYGVYNRGQDSAGILIYEQSNRNTFAFNSVTHGGDGFFLWAGQTTMDTGKGGCNDNLLYANDWSHAPTNGIEATFSRNKFVNNLILECWHGIWGGYSYDSLIAGNVFGFNTEAIALEHGQNNQVVGNTFYRDHEGLVIWQNKTQDPNWGYAKARDTRSRDYIVRNNVFSNIFKDVFRVRDTINFKIEDNVFHSNGNVASITGETPGLGFLNNTFFAVKDPLTAGSGENKVNLDAKYVPRPVASSLNQGVITSERDYLARFNMGWDPWATPESLAAAKAKRALSAHEESLVALKDKKDIFVAPLKGGKDPFLKKGALRGWRYMMVDEWGPYDFKRPLLWPRQPLSAISGTALDDKGNQVPPVGSQTQRYEILGPKGRWRVVSLDGATLSAQSGTVPGFVEVTTDLYKPGRVKIDLEYIGAATKDYRGITTPAGKPVRFGMSHFSAPIAWHVQIFPWDEKTDPRTQIDAFRGLFAGKPAAEARPNRLDYASGGAFLPGAPSNQFATLATGTFQMEPGEYTMEVTTDDGIRVWIDDKLVLESWKYQGPTPYTADLRLGGAHKIRVEHFDIDGYAALKVGFRPKKG